MARSDIPSIDEFNFSLAQLPTFLVILLLPCVISVSLSVPLDIMAGSDSFAQVVCVCAGR